MSWDIIAMDFPENARTVEEIPHDFQPKGLGPRSELIARIKQVVPDATFNDHAWGLIEGPDWSIELCAGESDPCSSLAFHVRGGDQAIGTVAAVLDHLKLRAVDCQSSEFFALGERSLESFHEWRRYRDRVVDRCDGLNNGADESHTS